MSMAPKAGPVLIFVALYCLVFCTTKWEVFEGENVAYDSGSFYSPWRWAVWWVREAQGWEDAVLCPRFDLGHSLPSVDLSFLIL